LPPELDNALALASGAGDEGGGGYMDAITKVFGCAPLNPKP